ncbi:hypothetical protein M758_5G017000 [Ceratodon purpureus]|nr:hypothetical protein M758_5G017000 [Ceratodon purpureus]
MSTASGSVPEAAANNPGYCDSPDAVTKGYHVQQTMYRIKDPKRSSWSFIPRGWERRLLKDSIMKRPNSACTSWVMRIRHPFLTTQRRRLRS